MGKISLNSSHLAKKMSSLCVPRQAGSAIVFQGGGVFADRFRQKQPAKSRADASQICVCAVYNNNEQKSSWLMLFTSANADAGTDGGGGSGGAGGFVEKYSSSI